MPTLFTTKMMVFTDRGLKALPVQGKPYEVREQGDNEKRGTGLRLRVMPSGAMSFRWVGKGLEKSVYTLGRFGDGTNGTITLAEARKKLAAYRERVAHHLDPEGATSGERPKTVKALCEVFYKDSILPRRKRPEEAKDIIDREIVPTIGSLPLFAVDTGACKKVVAKVVGRGATTHAGKVLQLVKQIFRYAASCGYTATNPAASLIPDIIGVTKHTPRERFLAAEEIPLLWSAIDDSKMDPSVRLALRLLVFTGLRTNEALTLEWRDVDLEEKTVTVRVENQKVSKFRARERKPFVQPLSEPALEILRVLRAIAPPKTPWVFYSPGSATGYLSDHALCRAQRRLWKSAAQLKGVPDATPHDYRRTMATHMSETLGLDPTIGQLCLGHSLNQMLRSGVASTYDKAQRLPQRRAALDAYATWVKGLIEPGTSAKIIPLAQ